MSVELGQRVQTPNGDGVVEEVHEKFGWVYTRIGEELWAFAIRDVHIISEETVTTKESA